MKNSHSFDVPELYIAVQNLGFYKVLNIIQTAFDADIISEQTANEAIGELDKFYTGSYGAKAGWITLK